ncbi:RNA polymerase II subunit B1 CTD phosphatase RPAP2-like protein isoform X2 [Wolffia australiana]
MAEEEGGIQSKLTIASAVHKVQISLLENGPCSESQLFAAGALISKSDYEDVVVERSIVGLCGNPGCPNPLPSDRRRRGRYRVSLSEHKVYDLEETFKFCSEGCVVDSRSFSGSLRLERCSSVGLAKVGEIVGLFDGGIGLNSVAGAGDLGFSRLSIRERDGVVAGEVRGEDWVGPSNAVEGYVPQQDRIKASSKGRGRSKDQPNVKPEINAITGESNFTSAIILNDRKGIPSTSSSLSPDRVDETQKAIPLKPCLKNLNSKTENRGRVKWADEEESKNSDEISHRLDSAEACATALVHLASSISLGEQEPGEEAASGAGIVLLPPSNHVEEEIDSFEFERGIVKWPKKTLETDFFTVEDSWHDTPPGGFNLTLSPFATMWNALFGWLTCSSLAYIYEEDDNWEKFLMVNGREYPRKVGIKDGRSPEMKRTMAACIARALPSLVTDLRLRVPVSSIEKAMGSLLETMSFLDALPPFKTKQWPVITLLFVHALSLRRVPALAPHLSGNQHLLRKVLVAAQVSQEEYEVMLDLVLPLGRLDASV